MSYMKQTTFMWYMRWYSYQHVATAQTLCAGFHILKLSSAAVNPSFSCVRRYWQEDTPVV